jgi:hypothetical protein
MEYHTRPSLDGSGGSIGSQLDAAHREEQVYQYDVDKILSNRRFRKVLEELKNVPKKKAAKLLTYNIKQQLEVMQQKYLQNVERVAKGGYGGIYGSAMAVMDDGYYRVRSHPDYPPTKIARRYAVFAYILLAAQLELSDVRPAIEDVIHLAKDEFKLLRSMEDLPDTCSFRETMLRESLYQPSILVTAAVLCNPKTKQNHETQKRLADKLVTRSIVDYRARTTEYDMPGAGGWCPIEPYKTMLPIHYYKGITDDEFNAVCP